MAIAIVTSSCRTTGGNDQLSVSQRVIERQSTYFGKSSLLPLVRNKHWRKGKIDLDPLL